MLEQSKEFQNKQDSLLPQQDTLIKQYEQTRKLFVSLTKPLEPDDFNAQSMPDVSPAKWHLAHTSWFFETFLLKPMLPDYRAFHPRFEYLFNSYYNSIGKQYPRPHRGIMVRPTTKEVMLYRVHVDEHMIKLLSMPVDSKLRDLLMLGINHEQQHQELFITDIKHVYGNNPLFPGYTSSTSNASKKCFLPAESSPLTFTHFEGGTVNVGSDSEGFTFDNERPKHKALISGYKIANRLITNGEYLTFIEAGGYNNAQLWLADGWNFIKQNSVNNPLYWHQVDGQWMEYTLTGLSPLQLENPVSHISFYEADAYARWRGCRLPTEVEWESAASGIAITGNFLECRQFHPQANRASSNELSQLFGDLWEWTNSPYSAYPGFKPAPGAVGEYNGKFMCNQLTLRGGSCVTGEKHIRPTYRNFFYPEARWQFTGIRLAEDV